MNQECSGTPVSKETLQYWAEYEPGGSGLSVSIQRQLQSMAIELLKLRAEVEFLKNKDIERSWEREYHQQFVRDNYIADGQWKQ